MAGVKRFTRQSQELFLKVLRGTGNVSEAAKAAGVSRSRVYQVRARSDIFASDWADAISATDDRIEAEAVRRAVEGVEEPYYYQGEERGIVRKYSDSMLMFLLKTRIPERYGDKAGNGAGEAAGSQVLFEMNFKPEEDDNQ